MARRTGSYAGPDDLNGATIRAVERSGSQAVVHLTTDEGRAIALRFAGVAALTGPPDAVGERVHALLETEHLDGTRFVFVAWESHRGPPIEIIAVGFAEVEEAW